MCVPCWAFSFAALRQHDSFASRLHPVLAARAASFGGQLEFGAGGCPICHAKDGFAVTEANVPELLFALAQASRPA